MKRWEEVLWEELNAMEPAERFIAAGTWTSHITQNLLTQLARTRRLAVVEALEGENHMDATAFAEQVGAGHSAVKRLAEEGNAILKRERERLSAA